ncbi:MAG: hypothetical protein Q4P20_10340, partial [Eubacteriales bacterium]|nr:hypothetical protein [Eubacteriales bacterium]
MEILLFLFAIFVVLPILLVCRFVGACRENYEQQERERQERREREERQREDARIQKEKKLEAERKAEQERLDKIRSEMLTAFSVYPWDIWPVDAHNGRFQTRRMERACNSYSMEVLSFTPNDYSARIRGEHEEIYSVTPQSCGCMDFKKRLLPCKHMYFLALTMFRGFSGSTFIGECHNVLSSAEASELRMRKNVEEKIPHKNILKFLQSTDSATTRGIVNHFSALDEGDVRSAVRKLYSVGSLAREKSRGVYHYSIPAAEKTSADDSVSFSPIILPQFPKFPVVSQSYRCYTNFGLYEVQGINPQTGKSNKRKVIALDKTDAYRAARVLENLLDPITVQEVPLPMATDRQIDYAINLGNIITDGLSRADVSALIDNPKFEDLITEEEWKLACEA